MPFYNYECSECSHEFEKFKTIAEYDVPLSEPCPSCYKVGYISRLIGSPRQMEGRFLESTPGRPKPSKSFNDLLHNMNKTVPGANIKVRD